MMIYYRVSGVRLGLLVVSLLLITCKAVVVVVVISSVVVVMRDLSKCMRKSIATF
jgi:hypothetical protein